MKALLFIFIVALSCEKEPIPDIRGEWKSRRRLDQSADGVTIGTGGRRIDPNGLQLTEGGFLANLVDAAFC